MNVFEDSLVLFRQFFLSHICGFSLICCLGAERTSVVHRTKCPAGSSWLHFCKGLHLLHAGALWLEGESSPHEF